MAEVREQATTHIEDDHEKELKGGDALKRQIHKAPILGDFNTIVEEFFKGGHRHLAESVTPRL